MKITINLQLDYDLSDIFIYCRSPCQPDHHKNDGDKWARYGELFVSGANTVSLLDKQRKLIEELERSNEAIINAIGITK